MGLETILQLFIELRSHPCSPFLLLSFLNYSPFSFCHFPRLVILSFHTLINLSFYQIEPRRNSRRKQALGNCRCPLFNEEQTRKVKLFFCDLLLFFEFCFVLLFALFFLFLSCWSHMPDTNRDQLQDCSSSNNFFSVCEKTSMKIFLNQTSKWRWDRINEINDRCASDRGVSSKGIVNTE